MMACFHYDCNRPSAALIWSQSHLDANFSRLWGGHLHLLNGEGLLGRPSYSSFARDDGHGTVYVPTLITGFQTKIIVN